MLVVSRKKGEEILVPQYGISVKILAIQGNFVRVGISAPAKIQLFRREVWLRDPRQSRTRRPENALVSGKNTLSAGPSAAEDHGDGS